MATVVVFVLAGVLAWLIVRMLQRWADKRERIANCRHELYVDKAHGWNAVERCRRCPYQRPHREIQTEYFLRGRCPHCHKHVNDPRTQEHDEAEANEPP